MKPINSVLFIVACVFSCNLNSQNADDITIETTQLSDQVYMLVGQGGNIGVSIGDDGIFVIDDQYAPLAPKIMAAIRELGNQPIRFLVNTHWHGDHTGGNEYMSKAGATILAHDNVRKRLKETPKQDGSYETIDALPVVTFNDKISLHINGETASVYHVDHAHTDGDALIYFTESNVLHTGDLYFNGLYPYIDLGSGGTVEGYIKAIETTLDIINDDTKIIPGHGKLSTKKEYQQFLVMLQTLKANVLAEISKGRTEDQVALDELITKSFDEQGYSWNFISSEKIRRTIYKSLKED